MNASHLNSGERVRDVHITEDTLAVDLADGRTIIVPLTWYPRLLNATMEQRSRWKVSGAGYGIHWPDVDEDLSTEGLLVLATKAGRGCPGLLRSSIAHRRLRVRKNRPAHLWWRSWRSARFHENGNSIIY